MRVRIGAVLVLGLVVSACGIEPGSTSLPDTTTSTAPVTTTSTLPTTSTTPMATTTVPTSTTAPTPTTVPTTTTTLPGEPTILGPNHGDTLMVAGVRYDDHLNLRSAPGTSQTILGTIPPTEMGLEALGETRTLSGTYWTKVIHDGKTGWVHLGYVGYAGDVDDMTAAVIEALSEYPTAPTMKDLGPIVADVFASDDPQVTSRVVQVTAGSSGGLGEIVFDVIGFADDSIRGLRLHIFANKVSDGYSFKTVEVMLICLRGVSDGACD